MTTKKFHEIFALEVAAISKRRSEHGRSAVALEQEDQKRDGTPIVRPTPGSNMVGLALSGGGIRSAAFSLGAMQALDALGVIKKIDYLSTVSGGGYIGTSMTVAMSTQTPEKFPFASELREGEVPGIQHIRDHSNYLFPQGVLNIFGNVVVYLRGILANVVLLLPWLLLTAAVTIWLKPNVESLTRPSVAGHLLRLPVSIGHFCLTLNALLAFVILLALWALWRSTPWGRNISERRLWCTIFWIRVRPHFDNCICRITATATVRDRKFFWRWEWTLQRGLLVAQSGRHTVCFGWDGRRISRSYPGRRPEAHDGETRLHGIRHRHRDQARDVPRRGRRTPGAVGCLSLSVSMGHPELQHDVRLACARMADDGCRLVAVRWRKHFFVDYKRRNPSFPHETTLDQLFTEEQFEGYRALGFHAVNSAFKCTDKVSMNPDAAAWQGPASTIPLEKRLRDILA
jgi:hypothetical protein